MKIRNGFVSNSSSSSFVVAMPKSYSDFKTKIKIETYVDLSSYGEVISNIEELDSFVLEEYCYGHKTPSELFEDEPYIFELYSKMKKAIEEGNVVINGSFGDEGTEVLESFLCREGLKGNVEDKNVQVIQNEVGY